jgi:CDP-diacylglycerol--serine O-phosphatidyltransferase
MTKSSFKKLIPNLITCLSLGAACYAIFLIMYGELILGGTLVLITALMDGIDGELARRLKASSEMGLQLDSLADVVCFGVAPAVLMSEYLSNSNLPLPLVWGSASIFVLCSALRLARYNTTIADDVMKDSMGLPTTIAGSYLALLVYLDYENSMDFPATWFIPVAAILLSAMMVSRIRFMSKTGNQMLMVVSLIATVILGIFVSLPLAGLIFLSTLIAHGLLRAAIKRTRRMLAKIHEKRTVSET